MKLIKFLFAALLIVSVFSCKKSIDTIDDAKIVPYTPQSERRFIRIGKPSGQFTEQEYSQLSINYSYVLFAKFHANFDIKLQHEAATRLKQLSNSIKVFPYFNTKIWHNNYNTGWVETGYVPFNNNWLLKDINGNLIFKTTNL